MFILRPLNLTFGEEDLEEGVVALVHGLREVAIQGVEVARDEVATVVDHSPGVVLDSEINV